MMPSFPFLKRSKEEVHSNGTEAGMDSDRDEKLYNHHHQQPHSKRKYLRSLLKKAGISSDRRADHRKTQYIEDLRSIPSPSFAAVEPPPSPMNKPLPPPPPPGTEPEPTPPKAPVQLQRIISPITLPELHKLFSGAPQFFCRSDGQNTGAPHPSVAFPWDEEVRIRDLSDHVRIQDDAWACVTAWPHITVTTVRNPDSTRDQRRKQRAHFSPKCRERPNMLSMQGLERGTVGFQAALEMGVADALDLQEEVSAETISNARIDFLTGKDGLRPIADSLLIDHLVEVGDLYQRGASQHKQPTIELYTKLFTQFLFPPSKIINPDDPYSLEVQIDALIQVLAAPTVWVDLGLVEWRIRLGQILWGVSGNQDNEDGIPVSNEDKSELGTQRYWLLLQVLLACELVIRLDTIALDIALGVNIPKPAEIRRFEKHATMSVKWSILLARAWLENIRVERPTPKAQDEQKPAGWLSTLTMGAVGSEPKTNDLLDRLQFHGRHQAQQLSGLVHFARRMQWPNIVRLEEKAASNGIKLSDIVGESVMSTPMSAATNRSSSYFSHRKPGLRRAFSSQNNISSTIHPGGWLSNSYISGLMLPGEGLSHFLMSTVLENDPDALPRLGEQANLYGGFVYYRQSFWSTACIVGRVLTARSNATECMGWVSSDVVPKGVDEGWLDIDVDVPKETTKDKNSQKPRIMQKTAIETEGNIIGGADKSSVLPGDFIFPAEDFTQPSLSISFECLDLFPSAGDVNEIPLATPAGEETEEASVKTYSAIMRFNGQADGQQEKRFNLNLSHDVHFITAHPCIFPNEIQVLKSPGSDVGGIATGHPLHKAFTYTVLPFSVLLSTPTSTPLSELLSSAPIPNPASPTSPTGPVPGSHTTNSPIPRVLVIDCTTQDMKGQTRVKGIKRSQFGSDLEMCVRAVCAERGWDALISRRGRGCLSCAIREAGALGIGAEGRARGRKGVVVRIA